jgi:hypothetical protein
LKHVEPYFGLQFVPRQATGARALWSSTMNTLDLTRNRIRKAEALKEAQRLMAKAYRGVEYIDAHHTAQKPQKPTELRYRGVRYSV